MASKHLIKWPVPSPRHSAIVCHLHRHACSILQNGLCRKLLSVTLDLFGRCANRPLACVSTLALSTKIFLPTVSRAKLMLLASLLGHEEVGAWVQRSWTHLPGT